jgi:hypothetical protein
MRPSASQVSLFVAIILILTVPTFSFAAPSITSLNPTSGAEGASVTITGSGFGPSQGNSTVKFNGTTATSITTWSDENIVVNVPSGATNGSVVVTVSGQPSNGANFTVTGAFSPTSNLNTARNDFTATVLNNGKVLMVGGADNNGNALASAELYDPVAHTFSVTGSLNTGRWLHAATLLNNGKVLITGGIDTAFNFLSTAELYDPASGTFSPTGGMQTGRFVHTTTLLGNGTVLIAGGIGTGFSPLASAELYNPTTGAFTAAANMTHERGYHSALSLPSGKVLLAGGMGDAGITSTAELYDPSSNTFTVTGSMTTPRYTYVSALLNDGRVLVAAGYDNNYNGLGTAEVYDATSGSFSATGNLSTSGHGDGATGTLLSNGIVLVAGGNSAGHQTASAELYDSTIGAFSTTGSLATARFIHTATLLNDGTVLIAGGYGPPNLASAAIYQPTSLAPSGLVSITVGPQGPSVSAGSTQAFIATGTFADNSTQTLRSVTWASSNPTVATISNDASNHGTASALATGSATVSACAGSICGSTTMAVTAVLVSISIAPTSPSVAVGAGQQLTATGTFSDSSTADLTTSVTWTSSDSSIVLIGSAPSGLQGFAMGVNAGTATITATLGSVSANTPITVQAAPTPNPPAITNVSPSAGSAGTQVTIAGTGFGTTQGNGTVWLGTTYGTVVSWTDTQILAVVSDISTSGIVQIQQNGLLSNSVPFTVNTATISSISPTTGVPGTNVTITGSGFGADQGNGQVRLGTANGIVQSWSPTQVVAQVAAGSLSGSAQILQGGVWSNSVPFTVNSLHIDAVTPNSGAPGASVTITGTGFGSSQGYGVVWLGSTDGQVVSWDDTQIVANVAPSAVSGVARVQQNGVWSNGITFTVPVSGGSTLTIVPNLLNLVVGEARTLQALDQNGQPVNGLSWESSDSNVVTLSNDDPPVLTASDAGHATITAGTASADVTVFNGPLPPGTVIWSNPGNGSGVWNILPAVPSNEGVADVFAFNADGTVQAIKSDGTTAWQTTLSGTSLPDFQGGLVNQNGNSITKLDGLTGQPYPTYTANSSTDWLSSPFAVHTDGTIFTVDHNWSDPYSQTAFVIGIDPKTGSEKFRVELDQSVDAYHSKWICVSNPQPGGGTCGNDEGTHIEDHTYKNAANTFGTPIIAGDGYAYVAYEYQTSYTDWDAITIGGPPGGVNYFHRTGSNQTVAHLMLLRVGADGSSSKINVNAWDSAWMSLDDVGSWKVQTVVPSLQQVQIVSNADQGVLVTWEEDTSSYCASEVYPLCIAEVPAASAFGLATTVGVSRTSLSIGQVSGQTTPIYPALQAQDGSFIGNVGTGPSPGTVTQWSMIAFDGSGHTKWAVPDEYPQIATADGGVIGYSGVMYDDTGHATGQMAMLPTESWMNNLYFVGSINSIAGIGYQFAGSYGAALGGNRSGGTTTVKEEWFPPLDHCNSNTPGCIGYHEAIYNALDDLVYRLSHDAALSALAQSKVFDKLGSDANGNPLTTESFLRYLMSSRPRFYNGLRSTYCFEALTGSTLCKYFPFSLAYETVRHRFENHTDSADTGTPSYPLLTFFKPTSILYSNLGKNRGNEAMVFHEALHGQTGLPDRADFTHPQGILEKLDSNPGNASCVIDEILWIDVLSHSAGIDPATTPCD